jgi:4-aminobutyrate--pyruvate transaminase
MGALAVTGLPALKAPFEPLVPGACHVANTNSFRWEAGRDPLWAADQIEQRILAEGPETVAAFWAEPIMGAGGVILPPATYFPKIQAVLKKYDVLFVADEVICGFWRTGNYWGSQTLDIAPDILVCAKALSSSYLPISAVMVNDTVFQAIAKESHTVGTFGHGFTYSGHPVPAAVAIETLKIYDELDIGSHVGAIGPHMQAELQRRFADHPLVGEVRGVGLIAAIELVADKAAHKNFAPTDKVGPRLSRLCEDNGVIGRTLSNDVLAFSPPLIITKDEIDEMLTRVGKALDELTVQLRREKIAVVS